MPTTINRRSLLLLFLGAMSARPALAQTPVATPATDYLAEYQAMSDALLATGRATIAALLEPNDRAFSAAMAHPDLASLSATSELDWLQTNRVRLRWSDLPLLMDGHFDGSGTMVGLAWQTGGSTTFLLTADSDQSQPVPTGRWTGSLGISPADLAIVVTFDGDEALLTATLEVPDHQLAGLPASSVRYLPAVPIGELVQDTALPLGPTNLVYRAEYAWGDALVGFDVVASPDEGVIGLAVNLREVLPPDPAVHLEPATTYQLPASGPLLVVWGGRTELQNYHAATPSQRHAIDLLGWAQGATYRNHGLRNADYLIWGAEVVAPVAGTVVAVMNDQADIPPLIAQASAASPAPGAEIGVANPAGNHVVLEVAPGTYVFLAHLQRGSVGVNVGDQLAVGDKVGLVGNSGNTSEPHLHIHAQTSPDIFDPAAIGLPLTFTSYLADDQPVASGSPLQGQFVEQQ